jgi:ubiquinone/menaquinone biosynthesis C-methylase UbiE
MTSAAQDRGDVVWQDASVVANYQVSSKTIPFVDVHFEMMHRVIEAAGVVVRNVLDLGAGNGIATVEVAARQPVERATLSEFSEPMFDMARERFAANPPSFDVSYIVGDFRESDWHGSVEANGPYDLVVSRFAIHHIPDDMKRALYGKVLTCLRPGGLFINIEHVASLSPMYNAAHDRLMVECMHGAASGTDEFDEVMASYRMRADGPANILAPVGDQLQWLHELGYVDVDCAFKSFELAVFAGRRPEE